MNTGSTVKHITNISSINIPSYVDRETNPIADLLIVQSADNAW